MLKLLHLERMSRMKDNGTNSGMFQEKNPKDNAANSGMF
jgi:hypothetical protein